MLSSTKSPRIVMVLVLTLLCTLLLTTGVFAQGLPPWSPQGTVTINGQLAPDGTNVTAWIGALQFGPTSTIGGYYIVDIPPNNPATPEKDGGEPGDTVTFRVNGNLAEETGQWQDPTEEEIIINLTVTVEQPTCNAAFSGSPTSGVGPLTVNFTDLSTGDIDSWDWDFGDNVNAATGAQDSPSHTYAAVNVVTKYTVSLTVNCGEESDTETKVQYITVNPVPPIILTADFSASPTSGLSPLAVQFTDKSTSQGCTISKWEWTFGDGGTGTGKNPSHTYAAVASSKTYDVSLKVTCGEKTDTEMKEEYIQVGGINPTTPTPTEIPEPSTVLLLVSGLAGLAGYARMRGRAK